MPRLGRSLALPLASPYRGLRPCNRARARPRVLIMAGEKIRTGVSSFKSTPLRPYADTPKRSPPSHASSGMPVATPASSTLPVIKSR
jgi:hypothetical protein